MIQCNSRLILRAAVPVLLVSVSSCASAANYVLTGRWEDPYAQEVESQPEAKPSATVPVQNAASAVEKSVRPPKPAAEPAIPAFPMDTTYAYGPWFLHRNARGFFWWTGKDTTFRLFAIELHAQRPCWTSQKADRPPAQQCPDGQIRIDMPRAAEADKAKDSRVAENVFVGIDNPPWKSTATGAPLAAGTYDLPDASGGKNGTFSLDSTANAIKIKTPPSHGGRLFTLPADNANLLVDGEVPELYDGCTNPDGSLAVYMRTSVQIGKKRCGILRNIDGSDATLTIDKLVLEFDVPEDPPDVAKARAAAAKFRTIAAKNKTKMQLDVVGDATYMIFSGQLKRADGESFALVESSRMIDGKHIRCQAKLIGADVSMFPMAKQVCSSIKLMK